MRTTFFANKKRIQEAKEKGKVITSKWAHYNSISFIDKLSDKSPEIIDPESDASQNYVIDSSQFVSNEWTLEEEEKLIFFFEDHPDLWDHRRENYKKQQKGQIMDDLIKSLNSKFTSKYILYT